MMPKASTFYAGLVERGDTHAFFYFQHSSKSWEVGQFTINVILSRKMGTPSTWRIRFPEELEALAEGFYRIGLINGDHDKWWRLKDDDPASILELDDDFSKIDFKG